MSNRGEALTYFYDNIDRETDECIIWPHAKYINGYGYIRGKGYVHVLACIYHYGPRPKGMVASHGPCHNTSCWNYKHLSWQTKKQDTLDQHRDMTMPDRSGKNNPNYKHGLNQKQKLSIKDLF